MELNLTIIVVVAIVAPLFFHLLGKALRAPRTIVVQGDRNRIDAGEETHNQSSTQLGARSEPP